MYDRFRYHFVNAEVFILVFGFYSAPAEVHSPYY